MTDTSNARGAERLNRFPTFCVRCQRRVPENHGRLLRTAEGYAADCGGMTLAPASKWENFVPSRFQAAIPEALKNLPHVVLAAVAGSGKTKTLEWLANVFPHLLGRTLALSFNRQIAEELRCRMGGAVECRTLNSFGGGALTAWLRTTGIKEPGKPDEHKLRKLAARLYPVENHPHAEAHRALQAPLVEIAELEQATLACNPAKIAENYGVDLGEADVGLLYQAVPVLVAAAREEAERGWYDFNDQIMLPAVDPRIAVPTFDTVLIDEAQDVNEAQMRLVLKAAGKEGRVIAVGDRYQAIYGFRGAGIAAFDDLLTGLRATARGAVELPLSICYRCPQVVGALVNERNLLVDAAGVRTAFEVREDAPEGRILDLHEASLVDAILDLGDVATQKGAVMVLCPRNAPLVRPCLALLTEGVKASIRGRDIGASIVNMIYKVNPGAKRTKETKIVGQQQVSVLVKCLTAHVEKAVEKLRKAEKLNEAQKITDQADVILAFAASAESVSEIVHGLERIFSDSTEGVVLSTVHRAKGLEARHVYLMEDWLMPWPQAKQTWERRQGLNLKYVAYTRAQETLTFVYDDRHLPEDRDEDEACGPPARDETPEDRAQEALEAFAEESEVTPEESEAALDDLAVAPATPEEETAAAVATEAARLRGLPTWPATGDGAYDPPLLADWREIAAAYQAAGVVATLDRPEGWRQHALTLVLGGVTVRVSTTCDGEGPARTKGANAIDVVRVNAHGRPIGGKRKVLRRAGWRGRVAERVNALLLGV
ncbi:MAG: ATP-dependent helicase [Deltaproteobacteria bacterium]|nr:ATP-dependent helicase [Deltaproteobacteria bacterium]